MKLAHTTLGCPDWDLDQIIRNTRDYGFNGIDFRGYLKAIDVTQTPEFSVAARDTAQKISDMGLEVPCFSTSIGVNSNEEKRRDNLAEIQRYAKLCPVFGATFLRVFGEGGVVPREEAVETFVGNIQPLLNVAQDFDAVILLETHDAWTESSRISEVVQRINSPSLRVLWDIHHPLHVSKEVIEQTWKTLGKWVVYTHWKDATAAGRLCMMGDGILPLEAWYRLLRSNGYDGYCTLEWEKRWHPDIEDPAIAYPAYVRFMKSLEKRYGDNS